MSYSASSRLKVLSIFKQLHKTRKVIFNGDVHALGVVRGKINEEFKKNKNVEDSGQLEHLLNEAAGAEKALRTTVVQAELNQDTGNYKVNIREDTEMLENKLFDPNAKLPKKRRKKCDDEIK